jgi:hypothetical protein
LCSPSPLLKKRRLPKPQRGERTEIPGGRPGLFGPTVGGDRSTPQPKERGARGEGEQGGRIPTTHRSAVLDLAGMPFERTGRRGLARSAFRWSFSPGVRFIAGAGPGPGQTGGRGYRPRPGRPGPAIHITSPNSKARSAQRMMANKSELGTISVRVVG